MLWPWMLGLWIFAHYSLRSWIKFKDIVSSINQNGVNLTSGADGRLQAGQAYKLVNSHLRCAGFFLCRLVGVLGLLLWRGSKFIMLFVFIDFSNYCIELIFANTCWNMPLIGNKTFKRNVFLFSRVLETV